MPTINQHWYVNNNARPYPLDDTATTVDDKGNLAPTDIIIDMALRFPETYGYRAALSSITATSKIVSVTIIGTKDDETEFSPLAVFTMKQPIVEGKAYALQAQVPGVGGWIVFGSGVAGADYRGKFSTPSQGLLAAKAARPYKPLPVESVRSVHDQQPLTGLISLRASDPLEIVSETLEINDVLRQAIVFRLVEVSGASGSNASGTEKQESVFSKFAGPCGSRPESFTCPDPAPIEFINSVHPNCFGQITLDFRGCARLTPIEEFHGALIECQASLLDVCPAPFLPNSEGLLPSEYEPVIVPTPPTTTTTTTVPPGESVSASDLLPYCECFDTSTSVNWETKSGSFGFVAEDSPEENEVCGVSNVSYESRSASSYNLAIWNGFDALNIGRVTSADFKLSAGPSGSKRNGGILLNYRPHAVNAGQFVWFAAIMDYDTQQVKFYRFTGTSLIPVIEVSTPGIVLDEWYHMEITVEPAPGTVMITIAIVGVTTPAFVTTIGPFGVSSYAPSSGKNGVFSDRGVTQWSYWCYDELPE